MQLLYKIFRFIKKYSKNVKNFSVTLSHWNSFLLKLFNFSMSVPLTPKISSCDVLVVGSGPIGCVFARHLLSLNPGLKVLIVEAGPEFVNNPGVHVSNLSTADEKRELQKLSEGPSVNITSPSGLAQPKISGTFLVSPGPVDELHAGLPSARSSAVVGGMGVHWACACPPPAESERIPQIPLNEWNRLFELACKYFEVHSDAFLSSSRSEKILKLSQELFDKSLSAGRKVQLMPSAVSRKNGKLQWTGVDHHLKELKENKNFILLTETMCKSLQSKEIGNEKEITTALLEDRRNNQTYSIQCKYCFVAADSLRTPQLLFNSGIRLPALGRYLNDQPLLMAILKLPFDPVNESKIDESIIWVPYDSNHPIHHQIHIEGEIVLVMCFTAKEISSEDRIEFSSNEFDAFGMPAMQFFHHLTKNDKELIDRGREEVAQICKQLKPSFSPDEIKWLPSGCSLHYQGSVRIGDSNDGTSVCDSFARVWGYSNLFVGGNGTIPTMTASNPTIVSAAVAIRAAENIIHRNS